MATPATGARASRRAAATAARRNPAPQPELVSTDEVVADQEDIDALADEAFGPDDVVPQSQAQMVNGGPAAQMPNGMPQAIQVRANNATGSTIALPQEDLTRKIDVGDLVIPKLRLSQAMSKTNTVFTTSKGSQGVQQGNWYHTATGENLGETVFFIPVDMRKSRAMFVQGQGLMCRSFDLLNGEGDPGGPCEGTYEERLTIPEAQRGCPLRLWADNLPPKCGVTYNYPGLIIRESEIENPAEAKPLQAILQLRSSATNVAKQINTMMGNEGGGIWSNMILELGVEVKTNPRGTFYNPTVDFYDTTDAEGFERIARRAASMARTMGNQNLRSSLEDDDS